MNKFTPKILIGVIVLFLVVTAGFLVYKPGTFKSTDSSMNTSDSPTLAASAENSSGLGEYYDGSKGALANASATPIPKPVAISEYIYPNSQSVSSSSAKLEMASTDNPTKVTDWYKKKIKELKFNAQSFATTNTNDDILNKLSAAKPGEKIEVTIKKDQNASKVSITVDRF